MLRFGDTAKFCAAYAKPTADGAMVCVPVRYRGWRLPAYPVAWQNEVIDFLAGDMATLFIHGGVGTYKTSLAAATFWAAAYTATGLERIEALTWDGAFVPAYQAAARIRDLDSTEAEEWKAAPFLVLDDIGANRSTPHVTEQLLFIIQYRYDCLLKTVVTSNEDLAGFAEIVDKRAASRMQEGVCLNLGARDARARAGAKEA